MALAPYAITVPRTEVVVDAVARTGQFSVDVKNAQPIVDRVVLDIDRVTPTPGPVSPAPAPADPTWFAVDRHLRPIPSGGSEQFLVTATLPAATAPGSYLMTPVAYSADRPPDNSRVTGPVMTLVLPAPPAPAPLPWWKRWWPWWLVAAVVAVLLIVAIVVVIVVLSGGGKVTVPDESGKALGAAQSDLQAHHLATGTVTQQGDTGHAKDTVLSQNPAANTTAAKNSAVALTVANNVTVPDVSGNSAGSATATLQGLGLTVNQVQQQSAAPPGQVVGTNPAANTRVLPNSTVTIIVATPILVTVPFVVNQTIADARDILTNAGLQVSAPNVPNCGSILFTCRVSSQTPVAGQQVPRGSTVSLTLNVIVFSRPTR